MNYKIFNVENKVYAMSCKHFDCSNKKCFDSFSQKVLYLMVQGSQIRIVRV